MNSTVHDILVGRVFRLVAVAVMLATAVSTATAAGLPEGEQTLPIASLLPQFNRMAYYRMYRPASWYVYDLSDDQTDGLWITNDQKNQSTFLSITVRDNSLAVTDADLPWLVRSFANRLTLRPGAQLEWQTQYAQGTTWVFEAKYTYPNKLDEGKRWVRVLYTGNREYSIVAEAPTLLEYATAEPMFVAMMATFRIE